MVSKSCATVNTFTQIERIISLIVYHFCFFATDKNHVKMHGINQMDFDRWQAKKPLENRKDMLCRKKYFSFSSIFRRGKTMHKRSKGFLINFAYWVINIIFHFEIDKRFGIPIGENLEEKKK